MRIVDRVAYINHDIDDALRAGVLAESELPAAAIAVLGETGSARIDALVHDLVETSEAAGDIVQGEAVGAAMTALREFMFERVYLGTRRAPRARAHRARHPHAVRALRVGPGAHPRRRRRARRRSRPARHRLRRRHDRPLRRAHVRGAQRAGVVRAVDGPARSHGPLHERLQGAGARRRRHGRPRLLARGAQARGRQPPHRPVPVSRRAHAVVRHQPGREGLPLLRLPGLGRRVHLRHGDRGPGLQGRAGAPRRPLQGHARARGRGPARRPSRASAASGCSSCSSARRRTTCASCGSPARRRRRASTSPAAACTRPRCASFASATRRAPGTRCSTPRAAPASATASSTTPAWPSARSPAAASTTASARRSSSRSPTRAAGCAASPGARWARTPASAGGRSTSTAPRASSFTRARRCSPPISRAGRRPRRRASSPPRATPTSSPCTRPASATPSRSWARR